MSWTVELERTRGRIRTARVVERAARWALYASLFVVVFLAALKIFSGVITPLASAILIGSVAAGAALIQRLRRFTALECAILLDRRFDLQERLSTALDADGAMAEALRRDAESAWSGIDPRVFRPRIAWELKGLALAGAFIMAFFVAPVPKIFRPSLDPELAAVAAGEAKRLRESGAVALIDVARELEAAESTADVIAALERLRAIETSLADSGGSLEQSGAAAASGMALSSALARTGNLPDELLVALPQVDEKMRITSRALTGGRHAGESGAALEGSEALGATSVPSAAEGVEKLLASHSVPGEYEGIVSDYFEVKR